MKKHAEYLIFAGTSEGRKLAEFLQEHQICAEVCVATEYGEKLLAATDYIQVHTGRMTEPEMETTYRNDQERLLGSNRCHASTCGGSDEKYSDCL